MKLNNRGFTLAELLVSASIGVILAGIATFAFIEALNLFNRSIRQSQAEADMIGAMFMIKSTYVQSTLVKYGGDASVGTNAETNRGEAITAGNTDTYGINSFGWLFRYPASTGSGVFLISLSNKEMGVTDDNSKLYGTGVYYQTYQNTNPNFKSGALFFDMEMDHVTVGGGWAKLSPVNAVTSFGRFTEFAVENIRVLDTNGQIIENATGGTHVGKPVLSAEFKLVMRYFTKGNVSDWRWCPAASISSTAACKTDTNYFDIEKRVKVVFANNSFTNHPFPQRPYGNLYLFKSIGPAFRKTSANEP